MSSVLPNNKGALELPNIPEPGIAGLAALGVTAMLSFRKRRRSKGISSDVQL